MRAPRALSVVAVMIPMLSVAAGCGPPFVVTDSFTPPPEGAFASKPDSLHDYVVGTDLRLDIRAGRAFVDLGSVEVVSKDNAILEVVSQKLVEDEIQVELHCVAPGTVGLVFLDDRQRPLEERVIEVKQPDEIELDVNIETDKGYTLPVIDGENLLLAAGGGVTFRVTYKADGSEVKGKGVLVGNATTLTVQDQIRESPDREFVTLIAPDVTTELSPVGLLVAGQVVRTLQVRNTPLEEVATIQLDEGDLPGWKSNGDVYAVWAKAFTDNAAPIWGAPFDWSFDSDPLDGEGDLVHYTYAGGERRRIQVASGNAVEDLTVEAKEGTAQVGSTQDPGCAATPGAPIALVLMLAAWRRRRR